MHHYPLDFDYRCFHFLVREDHHATEMGGVVMGT
jgi:hypothetical protein